MRTAILLLGHGSKAPGASAAMERVADEIRRRVGCAVAMGFMELNPPTIEDGLEECVRQGAEEVLALPYFLHVGQHVRRDVPEHVAAWQERHPGVKVTLGPPIGYHPALVDILLERIAQTAALSSGGISDCRFQIADCASPGPASGPPLTRSPAHRRASDARYHPFIPGEDRNEPSGLDAANRGGRPQSAVCNLQSAIGITPSSPGPAPAGKAIESQSFDIIGAELGPHSFSPGEYAVARRVIHATADFDFARNLVFHPRAIDAALEAIRAGLPIITDVEMVRTGVLRRCTDPFGIAVHCFINDPEVCERAAAEGTTRAAQAMRRAAREGELGILAVGNAPTALLEAIRLVRSGEMRVRLIIGAPVGFVSAAESKEALLELDAPCIAARGRKGGSPVAAAAVNALLNLAPEAQP